MSKFDAYPYPIHTNRELELMLTGDKPLAVFQHERREGQTKPASRSALLSGQNFQIHVDSGAITEHFRTYPDCQIGDRTGCVDYWLYTLPGETWRAHAYGMLLDILHEAIRNENGGSWSSDLEWLEGQLLGYTDEQNHYHISQDYPDEPPRQRVNFAPTPQTAPPPPNTRALSPVSIPSGPENRPMVGRFTDYPYPNHTNQELRFMLAGVKPLAVFPHERLEGLEKSDVMADQDFQSYVDSGAFTDHVRTYPCYSKGEFACDIDYWLYTLPGEEWRAEAYFLLLDIMKNASLAKTGGYWNSHLEWLQGQLLGYTEEQNRYHISQEYPDEPPRQRINFAPAAEHP